MAVERLVHLCGGPDVSVGGDRLHLPPPARRQAVFALAFLALESGRPVAADELADAVWPKGIPDSWQASLRRIVSDVRTWLEAGGIAGDVRAAHGTYELVLPATASADVVEARLALRAARAGEGMRARAAVDLLGNPLLPGFDAAWLEPHRREVERDYLESLDLLADAERRSGNADAAVAAAEQAIAIDPIRESSYRQVMAAHRQAGRIGAALRAYEACRRALADELKTAPSPATVTAYHALLDLPLERAAPPADIGSTDDAAGAVAAAAHAMHRLESRQTIAALEARLATIDSSPTPDPMRRVETLIELGRAHWVVEGSTEALRRISLAAGEAALSLRAADAFADALALASTTTGIGQSDPDAEDLCRRARDAFVGLADVQVRIQGLEAELCFGRRSIELAQQAVDNARLTGDDRLLLDMLLVLDQSLAWTNEIDRRLVVAKECDALSERVPESFRRRPTFEVMTRLQIADKSWFDEIRSAYPLGASRELAWEERVYVSAMQGVAAHVLGDLDTANQVATQLLVESAGELNTTHAAGGLLLAITRDAGGIAMIVPAVESIAASNPRIAAFGAAHALARVIAGDAVGGRRIVEQYAADGFDNIAHDHVYLLYLGLMAEAVALLGMREHVGPMLALLEPYEGHMAVGAHGVVVLNSIDTYRGMLATVTNDPRATEWFDAGMALEDGLGAVLLSARTKAWKAYALRDAELFAAARAAANGAQGVLEAIDQLEG